ncbi:MAG: SRPBCC family protein [Acidobacteriota bacterium]
MDSLTFYRAGGSHHLVALQRFPLPPPEVFPLFADASNLEPMTPGWLRFRIRTEMPIFMGAGTLIEYRLRLWGVPVRWKTLIAKWDPPRSFVDEQIRGPYAEWVHVHTFTEKDGGTLMEDHVRYRLPLGWAGRLAHPVVRDRLRRIFLHRRAVVADLLEPGGRQAGVSLGPEAR